jgi:hypothetical protein
MPKPKSCDENTNQSRLTLVTGYAMFLDFSIGVFLDIKHPVSNIEHMPGLFKQQEICRVDFRETLDNVGYISPEEETGRR